MIASWARMGKIIGPAFREYLPHVIRPLLQAASVKPEIAIVDCKLLHKIHMYSITVSIRGPP